MNTNHVLNSVQQPNGVRSAGNIPQTPSHQRLPSGFEQIIGGPTVTAGAFPGVLIEVHVHRHSAEKSPLAALLSSPSPAAATRQRRSNLHGVESFLLPSPRQRRLQQFEQ
jgi:hypothetical protein